MNISERSRESVYPFLRISDSKNDRAEKHQQVPELAWSLIEVMGFSMTVVNLYPSGSASLLFLFLAESAGVIMHPMHSAVMMCLIDIIK